MESTLKEFHELIRRSLEPDDPKSYEKIRTIFLQKNPVKDDGFAFLIEVLTGISYPDNEAKKLWQDILHHKKQLETKLRRIVGIQIAALDYIEIYKQKDSFFKILKSTLSDSTAKSATGEREAWLEKVYTPGYHLEKLKEELLRARRYRHALSSIMLDVDYFKKINELFSYSVGDRILTIIVKIIKKTIRNVDFLTRYSGDRFLLILPNTNGREAMELAERLRQNVSQRTKRIEGLSQGVTLTLSVGQCNIDESANELMKQLETTLKYGKQRQRNTVYSI